MTDFDNLVHQAPSSAAAVVPQIAGPEMNYLVGCLVFLVFFFF